MVKNIIVGVATAVLTAVILFYIGIDKSGKPIGPGPAQSPPVQTTPTGTTPPTNTPPPPPEPTTASINLVYYSQGNDYGCQLPIIVEIAGQTFQPMSNHYTASDLPIGRQSYRISGQINCPYGSCMVDGTGTIKVQEGETYAVRWQNTDYGKCKVWLQKN